MVVRLEGVIDGNEVIFALADDGLWKATVPAPSGLVGTYTIELTAYDQAGNMAYICKFLATFDINGMCVKLVACPYAAKIVDLLYSNQLKTNNNHGELVDFMAGFGGSGKYQCTKEVKPYQAKLITFMTESGNGKYQCTRVLNPYRAELVTRWRYQ